MTNDKLKVLDMSEVGKQILWLHNQGYFNMNYETLADLAFRLHQGEIAGKKPIEHIIDALIELDNEKE